MYNVYVYVYIYIYIIHIHIHIYIQFDSDNNTPSSGEYDLYAIANHMRVLGGGHYICYVKHKNGEVYTYTYTYTYILYTYIHIHIHIHTLKYATCTYINICTNNKK